MDIQSATQPLFQLLSLLNGAQEPTTGNDEEGYSGIGRLLQLRGETTDEDGGGIWTRCKSVGGRGGGEKKKIMEGGVSLLHTGAYTKPSAKSRRQKPVPFSRWQSSTLLSILRHADTLSSAEKELVAIVLGLSTSQVTRWFCNARARDLRRSKKCCELETTAGMGEGWGWEGGCGRSMNNSSSVCDEPMQHIDPRLQMEAVLAGSSSDGSSDGSMEVESTGTVAITSSGASPICWSPSSSGTGSGDASIRVEMDDTTGSDHETKNAPFLDSSSWIHHSLFDHNFNCMLLDPFFPHSSWLGSESPNTLLSQNPSFSSPPESFDLFSFFK